MIRLTPLILALGFLAACSPAPVEVHTVEQKPIVVEPPSPRPLVMRDVKWIVITKENINELINSNTVLIAVSVDGYEKLALNMEDIKRYLKQQKAIIVFYKKVINGENKEERTE